MARSASDSVESFRTGVPGSHRVHSDTPFLICLFVLAASYIVLISLLVFVDVLFLFKSVDSPGVIAKQDGNVRILAPSSQGQRIHITAPGEADWETTIPLDRKLVVSDGELVHRGDNLTGGELSGADAIYKAFVSPDIRYSTILSLTTCSISAFLSLLVAVPIGYVMSRFDFVGKAVIDTVLDIPIVLPPLVIGISLLVLFNFPPFDWASDWVVFEIPAVVLAQFTVACAFAVRTMRVTFDQIPQRYEHVAMTLGCNRSEAFWRVIFPQLRRGLLAAGTLAWARSLGEFGPILVFAGSTRQHTEVLPTSVYLELQAGSLSGMLAVSMIMIAAAVLVLVIARLSGLKGGQW